MMDVEDSPSSLPRTDPPTTTTTTAATTRTTLLSSVSSLAPSTPPSNCLHLTPSIVSTRSKRSDRFSLLYRLPKDLSSLFRSHSTTTRRPRQQIIPEAEYDYCRKAHMETDKSSKKESRLYSFLHRSRSRSRNNSGRSTSVDFQPPTSVPPSHIPSPASRTPIHARHSSVPDSEFESDPTTPSSKPPALIPSRPLSATTNTTHSTIGPLTPVVSRTRSRRRSRYDRYSTSSERPSSHDFNFPQPLLLDSESGHESDHNPTATTTTTTTTTTTATTATTASRDRTPTRRKLHTFLGITLPNPRKSIISLASRPASPEQHMISASRSTTPSRGRKSWLTPRLFTPRTLPEELPPSPPVARVSFAPGNKEAQHPPSSPSKSALPRSVSALPKTKTTTPSSKSHLDQQSPRLMGAKSISSTTTADAQSKPGSRLPQPSSIARPKIQGPMLPKAKTRSPSPGPSKKASISRPQITVTHKPATTRPPSRPATRDREGGDNRGERPKPVAAAAGGGGAAVVARTERQGNGRAREDEVTKGQRHDRTVSASSRLGRWSPLFFGRSGSRERQEKTLPVEPTPALPPAHRRSEADMLKEKQRDPIGATTAATAGAVRREIPRSTAGAGKMSAAVVRSKHGSFDFEKPLSVGIAIGQQQQQQQTHVSGIKKPTSSRRHLENRDMPPPPVPAHKQSSKNGTPASSRPLTPQTPQMRDGGGSSTGHSMNSTHTGYNGAGSGEAGGKGARNVLSSLGSGFGKTTPKLGRAHLSVGGHGHGSFAFEPPVPVHKSASVSDGEGQRDGAPSYKRTGKGRSLDLGLGLAWAPSKVKEEALLVPGFSRSKSTRLSSEAVRERERERERDGKSKVGTAVTETFRGVLGECGFSEFKKYVRRFDAQMIPFDGPTGIVSRVENLLAKHAHSLDDKDREELMDMFIRVVLQNA